MFNLLPLPFAQSALEPYISAKTIEFHYGKHHQAYVDNLNNLISGTPYSGQKIEEIILETANNPELAPIFNNAAQAYNHDFFWRSLRPSSERRQPSSELEAAIIKNFASFETFLEEFKAAALSQFGSGWAWLVLDGGQLKIMKTSNADTPIVHGVKPLITIDVWEHAYYLDYQNKRAVFVENILHNLLDWDFANHNFSL
jgi:Fe-Mn family superoxide dismutase